MSAVPENIAGRVAVVTGASSGIGQAIATRLLERNAKVAVLGRRESRLNSFEEKHGKRALPLACDLRDTKSIELAFSTLSETLGPPSILINNAGLGYETSLIDGDMDQYREMLEVNVLALCRCTQLAIQAMRANGDTGHIVHLSSLSAYRVVGKGAFYGATKHAVRALTEGLRQELRALKSQIRITAISPGFVETEFHENYFESQSRAQELYNRGALQPSDIADAVENVLSAPPHTEIHDVLLRSTSQVT